MRFIPVRFRREAKLRSSTLPTRWAATTGCAPIRARPPQSARCRKHGGQHRPALGSLAAEALGAGHVSRPAAQACRRLRPNSRKFGARARWWRAAMPRSRADTASQSGNSVIRNKPTNSFSIAAASPHAQRAALLRPVRVRGHGRANPSPRRKRRACGWAGSPRSATTSSNANSSSTKRKRRPCAISFGAISNSRRCAPCGVISSPFPGPSPFPACLSTRGPTALQLLDRLLPVSRGCELQTDRAEGS